MRSEFHFGAEQFEGKSMLTEIRVEEDADLNELPCHAMPVRIAHTNEERVGVNEYLQIHQCILQANVNEYA